jgi:hypothetical protein
MSAKRRASDGDQVGGIVTEALVDRVRQRLDELGDYAHLRVRAYGQHILIEANVNSASDHPRDRDAIARLTVLGRGAFGLSFRRARGGWDPIVLIDALEDILSDMTIALASDLSPPAPPVQDSLPMQVQPNAA